MVIPHEPTYSLPSHNTCKQDESFVLASVLRVCFKSCSVLLLAVAGHNVSPTERSEDLITQNQRGQNIFEPLGNCRLSLDLAAECLCVGLSGGYLRLSGRQLRAVSSRPPGRDRLQEDGCRWRCSPVLDQAP